MILDDENLPDELKRKILEFAGDAVTILSCERTCKSLCRLIRDTDDVWRTCPGAGDDSRVGKRREYACVFRALDQVRHEQEKTDSPILSVLGADGWKALVHFCVDGRVIPQLLHFPSGAHRLIWRGDTYGTLLEIVEHFAIEQFRRAVSTMSVWAQRDGRVENPSVVWGDFMMQDALRRDGRLGTGLIAHCKREDEVVAMQARVWAEGWQKRDKVLLRLARRAGVVKMEDIVFPVVWESIERLIAAILCPAWVKTMLESPVPNRNEKQPLGPLQTIRDVAPYSRMITDGTEVIVLHTMVPGQIEEAAASLNDLGIICKKVYGEMWISSSEDEAERKRADAEAEYDYMEDDGDFTMVEWDHEFEQEDEDLVEWDVEQDDN